MCTVYTLFGYIQFYENENHTRFYLHIQNFMGNGVAV